MHPHFAAAVKERRAFVKLITGRRPPKRKRAGGVHQLQPTGIQLAYFGALRTKVVLPAHALIQRMLVPELKDIVESARAARGDSEHLDAKAKKVNEVVKEVADEYFGSQDDMEELARRYADATSDLQRRELAHQLRAAVGVDVPINDAKLGPAIEHFTATNVSLIRTISERYFAQVEQTVLAGVGDGSRWEDIADRIEQRFKVSESVAKVIARDQVGKFYGSLNKTRQGNLGIKHFYWMTGLDERVCPICAPLHGKRFAWDDPPEEGLPSEVHPQCGCSADPDTDELVDDLEEAEAPEKDEETDEPDDEEPADDEVPDDESESFDRADEWNEEDHPRDEHGRFGEAGGGVSPLLPPGAERDKWVAAGKKAAETRRANIAKREEQARIAKQGGTDEELAKAKELHELAEKILKEGEERERINREAHARETETHEERTIRENRQWAENLERIKVQREKDLAAKRSEAARKANETRRQRAFEQKTLEIAAQKSGLSIEVQKAVSAREKLERLNGVKGNLAEKLNEQHPRLAKELGQQLHVVGKELQTANLKDIEKLPDTVLEKVREAEIKIAMGDGGVKGVEKEITEKAWQRTLKGRPRGYSAGSTFNDVGGCFQPNWNRVTIGTLRGGSESVALHELGHAVDANAFRFGFERGYPSNQSSFANAHENWQKDQHALREANNRSWKVSTEAEKNALGLDAAKARAGTNAGHPYFNLQKTAEANRSETFAESFATYYTKGGGTAGHENTAKAFGPHIADWHRENEKTIAGKILPERTRAGERAKNEAVYQQALARKETQSRVMFGHEPKKDYSEDQPRDERGRWGEGGAGLSSISKASTKSFSEAFSAAFKDSPFQAHVTHYTEQQLEGMKLFTTADGKAGVAVHDHGDGRIEATALFNAGGEKGAGLKLLDHVITHAGVNYVECYGPKLNQLYESLGFKVSTKDAFNPEYASPKWDAERFDSPAYYTMRLP